VPKVRYRVAMSLDGCIAGPKGEIDWIIMDPEIDFAGIMSQFGTLLVGRKTFDTMAAAGRTTMPGMKTIVFSRTLEPSKHPEVTIVREKQNELVASLRAGAGKDIWLFGGGSLFRSLLEAGLVDSVEVSIMPVLLGGGVPFLASSVGTKKLVLTGHKIYKSGIAALEYGIE
jgi:dihydrofolate reductase